MMNDREKYYLQAVCGEVPIGDHSFKDTGKKLVSFLVGKLNELSENTSLGICCTHDFVMGLIIGTYFCKEKEFTLDHWPKLLEGILIRKSAFPDEIVLEWRDKSVTVPL